MKIIVPEIQNYRWSNIVDKDHHETDYDQNLDNKQQSKKRQRISQNIQTMLFNLGQKKVTFLIIQKTKILKYWDIKFQVKETVCAELQKDLCEN